ncbi:MAG: glutamine synthetase beta-grasp domain-containing protein [Candidatus Aminicenantaceae bacterium]
MTRNNSSYALTNPLVAILNKPSRDFQRADFLRVIRQKQIERITFHFTALDGKLKELKLPVSDSHQAELILAEGERVDGSSLFKGIVGTELSDLYVVPEYKTAFLNPFEQGSLDFICRYLTKDGKWAPFTLDNILKRAYKFFHKSTGLELHALGELEFFIVRERDSSIYPLQNQQGYHESSPFAKCGEILNEIVHHLTQISGAVKYAHSEVGSLNTIRSDNEEINGKSAKQLEVEFSAKPIDDMADLLVLGKWLIRNISYKHGCIATFTPKIEEGVAGNGLHFHLELMGKSKNIMVSSKSTLSESALRLIGGLCEYADSLTAFGNTVSSSYLRLVPDHEAPTHIFWSELNRSALIRVPLGWTDSGNLAKIVNPGEQSVKKVRRGGQTVEFRTPDGSALIHLLLAGITMAAEWGLNNKNSLDNAQKLYSRGTNSLKKKTLKIFPRLPSSCAGSSRILLKKRKLYEREGIFPPSVTEYTARLLQAEKDEKISHKLASLSDSDRLQEIRRIMHKDLHRH